MKNVFSAFALIFTISSCSVQQFGVNTTVEPFGNCGRFTGEDTKALVFKKDKDIHLLGFNVRNSNTQKMAAELNASSYTIETRSNLWVNIVTCGIMDHKVVKVIKRDN